LRIRASFLEVRIPGLPPRQDPPARWAAARPPRKGLPRARARPATPPQPPQSLRPPPRRPVLPYEAGRSSRRRCAAHRVRGSFGSSSVQRASFSGIPVQSILAPCLRLCYFPAMESDSQTHPAMQLVHCWIPESPRPFAPMTHSASLRTLNDLFLRIAAAGNPRAVLWESASSDWQPISPDQIYQRVRAVARTLQDWGIRKDDRVAIIAENRWEWAVADFAILALGAADVPIYPTLTGEQIAELLQDSGSRIVFVSTRKQFDKLAAVRDRTPLERIVIMDSAGAPDGAVPFSTLIAGADERGTHRDDEFDALARSIEPDQLATLIYTSGTTGEPKGVMLTHGNIAANQNTCAREFSFGPNDACISFLPLSHITARALDYVMYARGAQVIYCSQFDRLPYAMKEVRPSVFVGVPRVYEKIRQEVERRAALSPIRKKLLALAVKLGDSHVDTVYGGRRPASLLWKLLNKLVYSKVHQAFGGRVGIFISGGAPLGVDTARWFASVGIAVWEGYGLTETSPVIALT